MWRGDSPRSSDSTHLEASSGGMPAIRAEASRARSDRDQLLAGSLSPRSIRRAARWADGLNGFSFGPSAEEIGQGFDVAREAWREVGRERPPRLTTSFWFALGSDARAQLDAYLHRYLNFMGPGVAEKLAPTVTVTSERALVDAARRIEALGADELLLVPTTSDPEEVDREADLLG